MQQRDFLLDQIEQAGRVIGKAIARYFNLKSDGNITSAVAVTNEALKSELDIEHVLGLDLDEILTHVKTSILTDVHLDTLATYVFDVGLHHKEIGNVINATKHFKIAQIFLDVAGDRSTTITFERIALRQKVENELS